MVIVENKSRDFEKYFTHKEIHQIIRTYIMDYYKEIQHTDIGKRLDKYCPELNITKDININYLPKNLAIQVFNGCYEIYLERHGYNQF